MSLSSYSCHSLASTSALSLKPESIYDHLPLASTNVPRPPLILYDEPRPAQKPEVPPEIYETPLFPFCSRYLWFTIDVKKTLAGLQDPEVDAVTEDMKGKIYRIIYVGCAVELYNTWSPEFTSAGLLLLAPGPPEQFTGIESWMSIPVSPQVESPRVDRRPVYPRNPFPVPGFCHWTILPLVTCRFPRERQEASDMPYLSSLGLHQYFAAQGGDPSMIEPFASAMPPPEMLAAQPFCLAGYDISSFSIDDIADPREFFAEQGVLYRFVRCFFKS
ncbi:hypothetical protein ARMSODRAFT_296709 [Armillaria solidipes]|uniref:Uncharacterized protein n=1 Tax=Armillaria solidipes TaxID=1076256 RepID=A0A2H3BFJ3_9AGAR|nr:hypothetical protein ARMSODRAFT_296709 [Armillaria solidipes]